MKILNANIFRWINLKSLKSFTTERNNTKGEIKLSLKCLNSLKNNDKNIK